MMTFQEGQTMFCIHCGAGEAAAFCRQCGKSQALGNNAVAKKQANLQELPTESVSSNDWLNCLDYEQLLRYDEPRRRIAEASAKSKPGVTEDDFLALLQAVSPTKLSLSKLTYAIVPIIDKLGVRTTNQLQAVWYAEPGRVLLATLCSLAIKSLEVVDVQQEPHACALSASIPLGIITNTGKVLIKLETNSGWVRASMSVTIAGQWYDWGKSKRLMEELLHGLNADLMSQNACRPDAWQAMAFQRVA
jgi:hypothetical protein